MSFCFLLSPYLQPGLSFGGLDAGGTMLVQHAAHLKMESRAASCAERVGSFLAKWCMVLFIMIHSTQDQPATGNAGTGYPGGRLSFDADIGGGLISMHQTLTIRCAVARRA